MTDRSKTLVVPGSDTALSTTKSVPASAFDNKTQSLQSADLFNGEKVVHIAHHGEIYRLQTTKLGKLILTK
ncbi:hemin uptake protein HemP [Rhodoferax sp. PAMC 29310]|uniref:hemin uptake protein HemP n=1 Tax=Rhodoferax sp. PAMC 29310 TaxID=2822760 RepID=UPI001B340A5B|nr:hemin uptake protein HemP [Rhodoferax sp. PAMC 29310]